MIRACDLCRGSCFEEILNLGAQPLAENDNGKLYPLALMRCEDCGLIQLSWVPPQEEVFAEDHPYTTGNSKERQRHFRGLAKKIAPLLSAGDLVVDIGANDGTFLKAVRDCTIGIGVLGVEPTRQAEKSEDIPMLREFFTWKTARKIVDEMEQKASVVTASNVLAHVPDPHNFMSGVEHLLADDGIFITENHDWNNISRGLQFDTIYHEHLRYYSMATLSGLLADHGLTITAVEMIPAHGGSFRVTAMKEPDSLQDKADKIKQDLQDLLRSLDGDIIGIGATTRATPLIHFTGIQHYLTAVCEVPWSDKIGQFIPGTRIPVVDEKILADNEDSYALLLSWHIADDIVPKIRQMGYKGTFITPLPEPGVYDG
jgi:hypothetical protein